MCTCADVPARLCRLAVGTLCAAGVLTHKCSLEAHILMSISSFRNFFHKSSDSENKKLPPSPPKQQDYLPQIKGPHILMDQNVQNFFKEQVLGLHPKRTQSESMGLGRGICSFHKLPARFQCPAMREEHGPRSMQSCGGNTNVKCRPKLQIHSNETLGH